MQLRSGTSRAIGGGNQSPAPPPPRKLHNKSFRGAGAAFLLIIAAACGDQSRLVAPKAACGGGGGPDLALIGGSYNVLKRTTPLAQNYSTTATIGLLGGVLTIPQAGLTVVIPLGALSTPTKVKLTANAGQYVAYTFEPHGTKFKLPVTVLQVLAGTKIDLSLASGLTAGYLPNGVGTISTTGIASFAEIFPTRLSTTLPGLASVFTTQHFSGYAYASGRYSGDEDSGMVDGDGTTSSCTRSVE